MKTTRVMLDMDDIRKHGSVAKAIEAACAESDHLSSGVVGPSFATSGPGPGWSRDYGAEDYAGRALSAEHGASGYVDSSDGRLATLEVDEDEDSESVVWSAESVVELEAPDQEAVDADTKTAWLMVEALESRQCVRGAGDWDLVEALLEVSEEEARDAAEKGQAS